MPRWGPIIPWFQVTPDVAFSEVGLDSLDTVEFVMALEDDFSIEIGDEDAEKILTTKDAIDCQSRPARIVDHHHHHNFLPLQRTDSSILLSSPVPSPRRHLHTPRCEVNLRIGRITPVAVLESPLLSSDPAPAGCLILPQVFY